MVRSFFVLLIAASAGALIASRRGRDWALWAIFCLIFPPAIIILLILPPLPRHFATKRCPSCREMMGRGEHICTRCGARTPVETTECQRCKRYVTAGSRCSECGSPLV